MAKRRKDCGQTWDRILEPRRRCCLETGRIYWKMPFFILGRGYLKDFYINWKTTCFEGSRRCRLSLSPWRARVFHTKNMNDWRKSKGISYLPPVRRHHWFSGKQAYNVSYALLELCVKIWHSRTHKQLVLCMCTTWMTHLIRWRQSWNW